MHSADPNSSRNQLKKPEPRPDTGSQNPAAAYSWIRNFRIDYFLPTEFLQASILWTIAFLNVKKPDRGMWKTGFGLSSLFVFSSHRKAHGTAEVGSVAATLQRRRRPRDRRPTRCPVHWGGRSTLSLGQGCETPWVFLNRKKPQARVDVSVPLPWEGLGLGLGKLQGGVVPEILFFN